MSNVTAWRMIGSGSFIDAAHGGTLSGAIIGGYFANTIWDAHFGRREKPGIFDRLRAHLAPVDRQDVPHRVEEQRVLVAEIAVDQRLADAGFPVDGFFFFKIRIGYVAPNLLGIKFMHGRETGFLGD